jgi:hypothetical protein
MPEFGAHASFRQLLHGEVDDRAATSVVLLTMAGPVDSTGPIEAFCQRTDAPASRRATLSYEPIGVGDRVSLSFGALDDTNPPYALKIRSPSGAMLLDRIIRELPTGLPQSEPPVEFIVSVRGDYAIEIRETRGNNWGRAVLHVVG